MPIMNFSALDSTEDMEEQFAEMAKLLNFLLNGNINFENIKARSIKAENIEVGSLTANEIKANSITAENIATGAITADKIAAGAITADSIEVNELSALSSNLGTIISGLIQSVQIFGSYIATANGTYPRCEMSSEGNLFGAYGVSGAGIEIIPAYTNDVPAIIFKNSGESVASGSISAPDEVEINGLTGLNLKSGENVRISGLGTRGVIFDDWSNVYSTGESQSLKRALDDISTRMNTLSNRITALGG